MKGQAHFVESSAPIPPGRDYSALCGKIIARAFFGFRWDVEMTGQPSFSSKGLCQKCLGLSMTQDKSVQRPRYVYGAVPGNEIRRREEGMEEWL